MSPYKIDKLSSVADSGFVIDVLQVSFDRRSGDAQRTTKFHCNKTLINIVEID